MIAGLLVKPMTSYSDVFYVRVSNLGGFGVDLPKLKTLKRVCRASQFSHMRTFGTTNNVHPFNNGYENRE